MKSNVFLKEEEGEILAKKGQREIRVEVQRTMRNILRFSIGSFIS